MNINRLGCEITLTWEEQQVLGKLAYKIMISLNAYPKQDLELSGEETELLNILTLIRVNN